ncbi:MAG TPA: type VI secretion system-associated FHA domain protein, partial [Planctomycetota bacterium]|nr:type VI secretion system-associated FHA domain protein [Planctomycetota bacterium]
GRGSLRAHEALLAVLRAAADELPPAELLARLPELAGAAPPAAVPADRGLEAVSARALQQLSRSLLGPTDFQTPEQVQQFVGKLGRFVDTTAHWIERMLELRKLLGKHLDLGIASTGSGRPSVRTASEVRALVAGWSADSPAAEPAAWYVAKFYDDVVAILVGLLAGNQQIRKAVKERLEPSRLVEQAGREATLRLLVQAAAGSALWKHYVQAFQEVTGGAELDKELASLLQRVSALRS